MHRIGVDSPNRAIIGTMAAAGLSSSVVAVIFQGAGATGLFLGPFTPPMVTLWDKGSDPLSQNG